MCTICQKDTSKFVFKHDDESVPEWFERLKHIDSIQLVCMYQSDENLDLVSRSYEVQGFTYETIRWPIGDQQIVLFNVLLISDIVFVTYGTRFITLLGWKP